MKAAWYFHRLRAMSVPELAHRVTERWKHRSDATFAESLRGLNLGDASPGAVILPDRKKASPELKEALVRDGEQLIQGNWKLFGWREVEVGTPPSWHRDAIGGVELAAGGLAHQLNHRALPAGADARTVWEINRWSEMVRLAMQAWGNDDTDAALVAIEWLEDWCEKNPVGRGINWTSPLEVGLRLMNFVWFDALVEELAGTAALAGESSSRLNSARRDLAARIVPAHAAWVWRYRSFGSSANNHLLGELVGLLHALRRWPALEVVTCPVKEVWQEISRCVLEQFAEDGGNKELALHYHLFAWEMSWHAVRLMGVTDGPVMERLLLAADFFAHLAHDGEQWEYGDNDDAQIIPLTLNREHGVEEWRRWMLGESGALSFWLGAFRQSRGSCAGVSDGGWWTAPESGMAACERQGWKARLDASPLGYGSMAAHGHCDALHLSLWDGAEALLIDPGTGGYFGMKEQRARLAAWPAHNGPQPVAGFRTPCRMGAFLWSEHHARPSLSLESAWSAAANLAHEGCAMERRVTLGDRGEVTVKDSAEGCAAFCVHWHLAPECAVSANGAGIWRITRGDRTWRVEFQGESSHCEILEGTCSRRYGQFEAHVTLKVTARTFVVAVWSRVQ